MNGQRLAGHSGYYCVITFGLGWLLTGCAALTNPVADGIPVRLLPAEMLVPSRETLQTISPSMLRRDRLATSRLGPGDILGVYVEGVLGGKDELPPVRLPDAIDVPPSIGFPIPVREDGTVSLPLIGSVKVADFTIEEAEQAIVRAYTEREILKPDRQRVIVTSMRPRETRVFVIREEASTSRRSNRGRRQLSTTVVFSERSNAESATISLPAGENDVLSALTRTGGLPSPDMADEIIIERAARTSSAHQGGMGQASTIRIPLRVGPGEPFPIAPEDVILYTGDIVRVPRKRPELFYCAGLLPSGEYSLPADYDLRAVEAVTQVDGPLVNGGINSSNLSGQIVQPGLGNPSPSMLTVIRRLPGDRRVVIRVDLDRALRDPRENIIIGAGDTLVLQETPGQAFARYTTQVFRFRIFGKVFERTDALGTADLAVPNPLF